MNSSTTNSFDYLRTQGAVFIVSSLIANLLMCCFFKHLDWGQNLVFTSNYVINVALRYTFDLVLSIVCAVPLMWKINDAYIRGLGEIRFRFSYCLCHIILTSIAIMIVLPVTQLLWMGWISSSGSVLWDEDPYVIRDTLRLCLAFCCFLSSPLYVLFATSPLDQWRRIIVSRPQ
jgi:hypothetical protein